MTRLPRFFDTTRFERWALGTGKLGILSPLVSRKQPNAQTAQEAFHEPPRKFLAATETPRLRTPPAVVRCYAQTRA